LIYPHTSFRRSSIRHCRKYAERHIGEYLRECGAAAIVVTFREAQARGRAGSNRASSSLTKECPPATLIEIERGGAARD